MGIERNEFNRIEYLRDCISAFLHSESKGLNQISGSLNAINRAPDFKNLERDNQKRKILEACLNLFKNPTFKELIEKEKQKKGILENVSVEKRDENNHKIASLSDILTDKLSEIVLSDRKRTYNMSEIATTGTVSDIPEDLKYTQENLASKTLTNMLGNEITIHHIGRLGFKCPPSADDYIYKYRVTMQIGKDSEIVKEIFSYIDLNLIVENEEYASAVANTLLSSNNIDFSKADGYIGEIAAPPKDLEDGHEHFQTGFYSYKIPASKYALVYDGTKIEAIRAYNKQLEKEKAEKEDESR